MCRQGCDDPVGSLAHGLRAGREQEHDDAMHTGGDEWNGGVSLRFFSCPSFVARDCSRADCALGQQDNGRRPMAEGPARPREAEGPDPRGPLPPKGRLVRKPRMLTSRGGVGSEGVVARIATARACIKQAQCRSGAMVMPACTLWLTSETVRARAGPLLFIRKGRDGAVRLWAHGKGHKLIDIVYV